MLKNLNDVGEPYSNIQIKVTVYKGEFMHFADLTADDPPEHGPRPIDGLETFVQGIKFARSHIAGNWVMTRNNFISKQDPIPGLVENSATLEIDLMTATQLYLLKKAVYEEERSNTCNQAGVEINFSSGFVDYIKYGAGKYYFRDAAIDQLIGSTIKSGE